MIAENSLNKVTASTEANGFAEYVELCVAVLLGIGFAESEVSKYMDPYGEIEIETEEDIATVYAPYR